MTRPPLPDPDAPATCRAVIFDLDDTLIDTFGLLVTDGHLRAAEAMAAALDGGSAEGAAPRDARGWEGVLQPLAREELSASAQQIFDLRTALFAEDPRRDLEADVLARLGKSDDPGAAAAAEAGKAAYHRPRVPAEGLALPGAHAMLRRLRRDFALFLVTIGDPAVQGEKARKSKLMPSFGQVRLVPRTATKAGALADLIATAGLAPAEVVCVGDRPDGEIAAANGLGMYTIRVQRGEFASMEPTSDDERAHWTVTDVREVQGILLEHFRPGEKS